MKKDKEWFIKELLGHEIGDYGNYYNGGYEDGLAYALKLAYQLDEPAKIVIPQFVADWWERDDDSVTMYRGLQVKKKHKFDLVSNFHNVGLDDYLSKEAEWIDENIFIFLELINGKPYEVEEEQKYYVMNNDNRMMLVRMMDGKTITEADPFKLEDMYEGEKKSHRLTEQEIKDYDERYFPFSVEVAE